MRLGAKLLDHVGDVLGLVHFGVAEVRRPVEIRAHLFDDVRKARQRLDRRIPVLIVDPGIIVVGDGGLVLVKPALRLDDLHRVGARGQELRQQRIRIERDGREQLFQFLAAERFLRLPAAAASRPRRSSPGPRERPDCLAPAPAPAPQPAPPPKR